MSASDDQVRLDILELLYKHFRDNPKGSGVDRAIIQDTLKLSEKQMDINMSHLENETLVALSRTIGSQWTFAKITEDGINVIENKERYADKYPFVRASTSQIQEEDHKTAFQTVLSEGSFSQHLIDAFRNARDQVRATTLSNRDREKIEKQLKALEKELLKNKKADLGAIQKEWEGLRKNASWLSPAIAQAVLEGIKNTLDLE